MTKTKSTGTAPVSFADVTIDGTFWGPRQQVTRAVTLPTEYEQLKKTGRIDAWRLDWEPGQPNQPHYFWDSDVAKWIEAAGYSLATRPDQELEQLVDDVIEIIEEAQQEDGYLNIYFTMIEPEKRWTNLRDMHELYCAGHLIEAAIAYYQGTGKRKLLDVMCRYADHIDSVFGPGKGKKRGYPGHEEIELALVRLYTVTEETRYLNLASFFVDERGRQPHYYDIEAQERGEDPGDFHGRKYDYNQSHLPVREQTTAEGHAVRAMYLYSGMTDVAAETGDESLLAACRCLWKNVTERRMYVTGGIGSSSSGERFTYDYDLPNDLAYAETCAAIGLMFWAHRMLQLDADSTYADVLERALYNGVLSGVSLDGKRFFYANPLEVDPKRHEHRPDLFGSPAVSPTRQEWFGCACCPPNLARLLSSLGQYIYSQGESEIYVHLYVGGQAQTLIGGQPVVVEQETRYPWDGTIQLSVRPEQETTFTLSLRIPGWCQSATLSLNGQPLDLEPLMHKGYARIQRTWKPGDTVVLELPMMIERVQAHPSLYDDGGCIALQRGPLIYCLEEVDNGPNLRDITLPRDAELKAEFDQDLLGGVFVISGQAKRRDASNWEGKLYRATLPEVSTIPLKAIPYYAWANRTLGEMLVWITEA